MDFTRSPVLWGMGRRQRPDRLTEGSGSLWDSGWRTGTSCNHSLVGEMDIIRDTNLTHTYTHLNKHTSEGTCEGIHEGGERAIEHLKEGVSTGEALRAAQNRVLQNVRNTGAVHRRGTKLHTIITHAETTGTSSGHIMGFKLKSSDVPKHSCPSNTVPEEVVGIVSGCMQILSSCGIMGKFNGR